MRITKKYAGASCLGRRIHHFRERPPPTIAQMQWASAELELLQRRFRLRIEEGCTVDIASAGHAPNVLLQNIHASHSQGTHQHAATQQQEIATQQLLLSMAALGVPLTTLRQIQAAQAAPTLPQLPQHNPFSSMLPSSNASMLNHPLGLHK
jgi:hypothetical protein